MIVSFVLGTEEDSTVCEVDIPGVPAIGARVCVDVGGSDLVSAYTVEDVVWWLDADRLSPEAATYHSCMVFLTSDPANPSDPKRNVVGIGSLRLKPSETIGQEDGPGSA